MTISRGYALPLLLASAIAAPTYAEESIPVPRSATGDVKAGDTAKALSFAVEIAAAPVMGASLEPDAGNDLIDESEYSASVKINRDMGKFDIGLTPALSYSPNYYDSGDAESALGFTFGFTAKRTANWNMGEPEPTRLSRQWYLRYRLSAGYNGMLQSRQFTDHTASAGIKFESPAYILCVSPGSKKLSSNCRSHGKIGFAVTPELAFIGSTSSDRRRVVPSLTGALNGPVGDTAFLASAKVERRLFGDKLAPTGAKQNDWRLTVEGGLNLAPLLSDTLPEAVSLTAGGRYVRSWSNNPDARFKRGYFIPNLTITIK